MFRKAQILVCASLLASITVSLHAATDTFIESADGKRLVRLESPELEKPYLAVSREATGETVVYVHDNEILKDIHDPAIFVVDVDPEQIASMGPRSDEHGNRA